MDSIRISTAQFEHRSGDKSYNLDVIDRLSAEASRQGSKAIAFHECSITGYTFARKLDKQQMLELAEVIPGGPSIQTLIKLSKKNHIAILAGLFEKDSNDNLFKAYVCVNEGGVVAKF